MILAADCVTTTRPSVRRLVDRRDEQALIRLVSELKRRGASWVDLNPGRVKTHQRRDLWGFLIRTAEKVGDVTLMVDTPEPEVMEMAMSLCSRPPVLNFATAQEARLRHVLEIAASHDLTVVAATMDETVPRSMEDRLALASVIVEEARAMGIAGERLVLDPMVMPLSLAGGEEHAHAVVRTVRAVGEIFSPRPLTLAALSNLYTRSAGPGSAAAAPPYLCALWGAGLDVALVDLLDEQVKRAVRLCEVFQGRRLHAPAEHDAKP